MIYYIYIQTEKKLIGIVTKDRNRYLTCRQWANVKGYEKRIYLYEKTPV